jgi:hypothetical protein
LASARKRRLLAQNSLAQYFSYLPTPAEPSSESRAPTLSTQRATGSRFGARAGKVQKLDAHFEQLGYRRLRVQAALVLRDLPAAVARVRRSL